LSQESPLVENSHLIRQVLSLAHVVGREQNAATSLAMLPNELMDFLAGCNIESVGGFVQQKNASLLQESPGPGEALLLSARKLGGGTSVQSLEPHLRE